MQGFTGWHLSLKALRMITHFDLTAQSIISGWDRDVMARKRTFSLTTHVRMRKLEFLARTIEMPTEALPRRMLQALHLHIAQGNPQGFNGTIFMDVPDPADFAHMVTLVQDGERWAKWKAGKQWPREKRYGQTQRDTGRRTRSRGPHEEEGGGV